MSKQPADYCMTGKVKFDKKGATTAMNKRWDEEHVELRIYHCDACNAWHLTKQMRRQRPWKN